MSDMSQGPGWWQASDDKWYAPERHPDYVAPPPPPAPVSPAVAPGHPQVPTGTTASHAQSGGQVLTLDREIATEPVWRAGSKRPSGSVTAADADKVSGLRTDAPGGSRGDTVSSAVGALKGFLFVCLAVNLVYLLVFHLIFRAFVKSFLFTPYAHLVSFLAHSSPTPPHFIATFVHIVQVVALVDLLFLLVLLLSRSARVVITVLRVWLGLSLLTVVLGVVSHVYLESEWAFVTALYVLHVVSQVAGAGHASPRSYRARPVLGYTIAEVALAVAIAVVTVISAVITLQAHNAGVGALDGGVMVGISPSGRTAPPGTDPIPSSWAPMTAQAHDFTVSLIFDPNAAVGVDYNPPQMMGNVSVPTVDGVTIIGKEVHSTTSVLINVLRLPPNVGNDTCPTPAYTATVMGQPSTVCQGQGVSGMEVDFVAGGSRYQVLMATPRSPTPLATSVAQVITGSLKIG